MFFRCFNKYFVFDQIFKRKDFTHTYTLNLRKERERGCSTITKWIDIKLSYHNSSLNNNEIYPPLINEQFKNAVFGFLARNFNGSTRIFLFCVILLYKIVVKVDRNVS